MSSILKVSEIQDPTNGNSALTVDSSGRVLTPARPAFHAYPSANTSLTGGNDHQVFPFNATKFNIGGHFSTSTYVFTCPVDGLYFFSLTARLDSMTTGGYARAVIFNGDNTDTAPWAVANRGDVLLSINGNSHSTDYETMVCSGLLQCSANDTVTAMGGHNSDGSITLTYESQFTGFLVG